CGADLGGVDGPNPLIHLFPGVEVRLLGDLLPGVGVNDRSPLGDVDVEADKLILEPSDITYRMHVDEGRPATHIDRESFEFLWESTALVAALGRPGALVPLHPRVVLRTKEPGVGFRGEDVQVPTRLDAVDVRPQSNGELLNGHHLPVKQRLYGLRIEGPLD